MHLETRSEERPIDDTGGIAGATVHNLELVCQEQGIDYVALLQEIEQDGAMIPNPKKTALNAKAQDRYLAAVMASRLHNKRHRQLKNEIKNLWVTQKRDILPKNLSELHKMIEGYVDDKAVRFKPGYDPNEAGAALVDACDRRQRDGRNEGGQDMTGIKNTADTSGCNRCRDEKHWIDNCTHRHVTGAALEALRKNNTAAPQLLHASEEKDKGGESDDDPILSELEGVALASPAAGITRRSTRSRQVISG